MPSPTRPSPKTIARLSLYRRLLRAHESQRNGRIYSHELGQAAGVSAAQVRRDIMELGYSGTPNNGYDVQTLIESIASQVDPEGGQQVALMGVGNLGRAVLSYFSTGRKTALRVVAAFDAEPAKTGRVLHGCRCYPLEELTAVVDREAISVGIIAVPAEAAQVTADRLVAAGITGILNFAPVPIRVPPLVYTEDMDITIKLETVAYFARRANG